MDTDNTKPTPANAQAKPSETPRRPNECGSIRVEAHLRIFDPQTRRVYVEGRA